MGVLLVGGGLVGELKLSWGIFPWGLLEEQLHSFQCTSPYAVWHSFFSIPRQSFYRERVKSLEEIFSSSENTIWSILLKYQEIDVQIQAFTDEI